MPICVAYSNLIGAVGGFLGAGLGGILSVYLTFKWNILLIIFVLSFIARLAVALSSNFMFKEIRKVEEFTLTENIKAIIRLLDPRILMNHAVPRLGMETTSEASTS
jgi:MFS family permease